MAKILNESAIRRRELRAERVIGPNGDWYAPRCPDYLHGRSGGATYWQCRCDLCKDYGRTATVRHRERRRHNRAVLEAMGAAAAETAQHPAAPEVAAGVQRRDREVPSPSRVEPAASPPAAPLERFIQAVRRGVR